MEFYPLEYLRRCVGRNNRSRNTVESLKGLEGFLNNIYWGSHLTKDEAKNNIEEGLVEIKRRKFRFQKYATLRQSKGLMITYDGYIITAAHCIEGKGWITTITTREGTIPLEKICAMDEQKDIALIKAFSKGEHKPRSYPFYSILANKSIPCVYIKLEGGNIHISGCMSKEKTKETKYRSSDGKLKIKYNQVSFIGNAIPGDSGSPILTSEAQIIGIVSGYDDGVISGPHINAALDLITKYIAEEMNKRKK